MSSSPQAPLADAAGVSRPRAAVGFDLAPYPAILLGAEPSDFIANDAAERLFGQALKLLVRSAAGQGPSSIDALAESVVEASSTGAAVRRRSVWVRLPDRPALETDLVATPLGDAGLLLTFLPCAQAPQSERRAETLKTAAGMGRTLAHEVKNPLSGIRGAAQLLQAGASAEDAALAQLIVDETDRIRRLIDRVEAFSDPRPPERRPVNIHRVLDRVRAVVAAGAGDWIVLRERYDPSLPEVMGDQDQLVQMFLNLLKNAAEAAGAREDGQGEILISTAYRQGARAGRTAAAPLEVSIQDNGPGVPAGLRQHLFDPFITTKPQGAGLGLTLAAKLAAAHGGEIEFESEPGRTTFYVRLPIAPAVRSGATA